jgi:hypothetical protein
MYVIESSILASSFQSAGSEKPGIGDIADIEHQGQPAYDIIIANKCGESSRGNGNGFLLHSPVQPLLAQGIADILDIDLKSSWFRTLILSLGMCSSMTRLDCDTSPFQKVEVLKVTLLCLFEDALCA